MMEKRRRVKSISALLKGDGEEPPHGLSMVFQHFPIAI